MPLTPPYPYVVNVQDSPYNAQGDGTTDDTAAIQTAIDDAAGKTGVHIPATGSFYKVAPAVAGSPALTLPSATRLHLDGTIKLASSNTSSRRSVVATAAGADGVEVFGPGIIDGNVSGQTGSGLSGGFESSGGATNIRLESVTIQNVRNWPVNIVNSSDVLLQKCTFKSAGSASEFAVDSKRCWAIDCSFSDITSDIGFSFYGGVTDSGIVSSSSYSNLGAGINILNDTAQPAACHRITIANNIVYLNGRPGISVGTNGTATEQHTDVIITGNHAYKNVQEAGTSQTFGINLANVSRAIVTENVIHEDGIVPGGTNNRADGIRVTPESSAVVIANNVIFNEGGTGTDSNAVLVKAGAADFQITGNRAFDLRQTKIQAWGVKIEAGASDRYIIAQNDLTGNINAAGLSDGGTGLDKQIFGNLPTSIGHSFATSGGALRVVRPGTSPAGSSLDITSPTSLPGLVFVEGTSGFRADIRRSGTELQFAVAASGGAPTTKMSIDNSGDTTFTGFVKSSSATKGVGYAAGAGAAATQGAASGKATTVTLNTVCGKITMNNASLAAAAEVTFTLSNTTIDATDVIVVNHSAGGTAGAYLVGVSAVAADSCKLTVSNVSGGALGEAIVLSFAVIKAVTS